MNYYFREISSYSVASTTKAAFVIGGFDVSIGGSSSLDVIAKFENNKWSRYGNLQNSRYNHESITSGTQTIVIGGSKIQTYETWPYENYT